MPVEEIQIDDPGLARIFADSAKRRLLLDFVETARSVSDVAARLGWPLARVHYHVRELERRGLLAVEQERKRRGRPIRFYRAAALRFVVPVEALASPLASGLGQELRASLDRELIGQGEGSIVFDTENGQPRMRRLMPERRRLAAGEYWQLAALDADQAAALASEIQALLGKYQGRPGKKRPYLIYAAFAPRLR